MRRKRILAVFVLCLAALLPVLLWLSVPLINRPPFEIPRNAKWTFYRGSGAGLGPGFEEWARFSISPKESVAAGEDLLRSCFNEHTGSSNADKAFKVSHANMSATKDWLWMDGPWWFRPEKIRSGIQLNLETMEGGPVVWVDTEKGHVYYMYQD